MITCNNLIAVIAEMTDIKNIGKVISNALKQRPLPLEIELSKGGVAMYAPRIPRFALAITLVALPANMALAADPVTAFFIAVGKAAVQEMVKQAASFATGEIYDAGCDNPNNPQPKGDAINQLGCAIAKSVAGRGKAEFESQMRQGLQDIKEVVDRIEVQVNVLEDGQKSILNALKRVEVTLASVSIETVAENAGLKIRSVWRDEFAPAMRKGSTATSSELLKLARRIVMDHKIDERLGEVTTAMVTRGVTNKPPLLEQHMDVLLTGIQGSSSSDLVNPHDYYRGTVQKVLADYGRGEIMYAWAIVMLEAECTGLALIDQKCAALPISSEAFHKRSLEHRTEILNIYRNMVERLVLSFSDPSSIKAGFLHEDALSVLYLADAFIAVNLEERRGIHGRVISAGEAFSGQITINGKRYDSSGARNIAAARDIDWWTRPSPSGVYDTVHFAKNWTVHDVVVPEEKTGVEYQVEDKMPWHSGPFGMIRLDASTGEQATASTSEEDLIEFGSFVAIARAGGAYAMMRDAWPVFGENDGFHNEGSRTFPAVGFYNSGSVIYRPERALKGDANHLLFKSNWEVRRRSPIKLADGGTIRWHGRFKGAEDVLAGARNLSGLNGIIPKDAAVFFNTQFRSNVISGSSSVKLRTGVNFSPNTGGNFTMDWALDLEVTKPTTKAVQISEKETRGKFFPAGISFNGLIFAELDAKIYTTGFESTPYVMFAGTAPTALYITRD